MPLPIRGNPFEKSDSIDETNDYNYNTSSNNQEQRHAPLKRQHTQSISVENTALTEIITIYEKLKSRNISNVFRYRPNASVDVELKHIVEETLPIKPSFNFATDEGIGSERGGEGGFEHDHGIGGDNGSENGDIISETTKEKLRLKHTASIFHSESIGCSLIDFNKYQPLTLKKYTYFSAETNCLQANHLDQLSKNYIQLLTSKYYWLNIIDPSELDLAILFQCFNVHDLTLSDIREGNTAEKIEIFKHYTFISMRLFAEPAEPDKDPVFEDVDFNILLFKDFVITMHDKEWASIKDILGVLDLISTQASTTLTPDWILFSIFIELAQDAQGMLEILEPEINQIRSRNSALNHSMMKEMSETMRRNFDMEFQVYKISRFLKPKMNILRMLKNKCGKRLSKVVISLLSDIYEDFREISQDLNHFNHILERSQDTYLALVNLEESRQANTMSQTMKTISEIALVFAPVQAIAGFFGMNVTVPFQTDNYPDWTAFFLIVIGSLIVALCVFICRKLLRMRETRKSQVKFGKPLFRRFSQSLA